MITIYILLGILGLFALNGIYKFVFGSIHVIHLNLVFVSILIVAILIGYLAGQIRIEVLNEIIIR
ncbi:MAG: hypothetical protein N4A63_13810 [Vallitalea sp.]|jgi:hypothetical protein|nr:hypothetical protein [Vallitalea sp.]